MSKHYILQISISLRTDLNVVEDATLDFLINGVGSMPTQLPDHPFLRERPPRDSLATSYGGFAQGEYVAAYWRRAPDRSGVSLLLPGIIDLQGWYEALKLVDWLCSLAASEGLIGYICDEDDRSAASFLYSFGAGLYLRTEKDAGDVVSFSTGQRWGGEVP